MAESTKRGNRLFGVNSDKPERISLNPNPSANPAGV